MRLQKVLLLVLLAVILSPISAFSQDDSVYDPWEPFNRKVFWLNDKADRYAFEHIARGYEYITPDPIEQGVGNFFNNLRYPKKFVSSVCMGDFSTAGWETLRFVVNTTLGIGGFFDVADKLDIPESRNDMGLALAHYDIPPGPYLVLPFLGPSNVRDGIGRGLDALLDPMFWVFYSGNIDSSVGDKVSWGSFGLYAVDERAGILDTVDAARETSVDFYLTSQGAYTQYRNGLLERNQLSDEELLDDEFDDF